MEYNEEKLIFVAGVPRSGTTLVQNILDCHPDIYGGSEFDRIPNIIDLRRKLLKSIKLERINDFVSQREVDSRIADLIKIFLFPVAHRNNCSFVSEKTPWNILAFRDLIEILPKAKFVHVIRNPLSVIASIMRVGKRANEKGTHSPDFAKDEFLTCYYIESVLKLINDLQSRYPQKIFTLKYENILDDPLTAIQKLCDYIGVGFDRAMLEPGNKDHPGREIMTRDDSWYSEELYNRNIDNSGNDKWKHDLSAVSKAFIHFVFMNNKFIGDYSYEFSKENISLFSRLSGYLRYRKYQKKYKFSVIPFRTLN